MEIREETSRDEAAIRVVHRTVFGLAGSPELPDEARLVDRLREDGKVIASVVAEPPSGGKPDPLGHRIIAGHALFSDLPVDTDSGVLAAVSLAPVAVLPEYQRCGIGSALIREGLDLCRQRSRVAAIVVGDPKFYRRFGFSSGLARNLQSPYSSSGKHWMALELVPGSLRNVCGLVRYPKAFEVLTR